MRVSFIAFQFLDKAERVLSGGAELHLYNLIKAAQSLGLTPDDTLIVQMSDHPFDVKVPGIGRVVGIATKLMFAFRWKALQLARQFGATAIHYNDVALAPLGRSNAVATATFHGVGWDVPDPFPVDWTERPTLMKLASRIYPTLMRWATTSKLAHLDGVLSVDRSLHTIARTVVGRYADRVAVIPNALLPHVPVDQTGGVDLSALKRARSDGKKIVLYPRNVSVARGVHFLPRIVRELSEQFGDNFRLAVTGKAVTQTGPYYVGKLLADMDAAGLSQYLVFLGGVPRWQMDELYTLSDVVIVPTFFSEGTSLSAIEALHHGIPLVVTNVGGLPEVVWDGYTGLVVEPEAPAISSAIIRLLNDRVLAASLADRGRQVAAECYSEARWARQVAVFLEKHWQ